MGALVVGGERLGGEGGVGAAMADLGGWYAEMYLTQQDLELYKAGKVLKHQRRKTRDTWTLYIAGRCSPGEAEKSLLL